MPDSQKLMQGRSKGEARAEAARMSDGTMAEKLKVQYPWNCIYALIRGQSLSTAMSKHIDSIAI